MLCAKSEEKARLFKIAVDMVDICSYIKMYTSDSSVVILMPHVSSVVVFKLAKNCSEFSK